MYKWYNYKKDGKTISFLDQYEEEGERNNERIRAEGIEAKAEAKAQAQHRPLKEDDTWKETKNASHWTINDVREKNRLLTVLFLRFFALLLALPSAVSFLRFADLSRKEWIAL